MQVEKTLIQHKQETVPILGLNLKGARLIDWFENVLCNNILNHPEKWSDAFEQIKYAVTHRVDDDRFRLLKISTIDMTVTPKTVKLELPETMEATKFEHLFRVKLITKANHPLDQLRLTLRANKNKIKVDVLFLPNCEKTLLQIYLNAQKRLGLTPVTNKINTYRNDLSYEEESIYFWFENIKDILLYDKNSKNAINDIINCINTGGKLYEKYDLVTIKDNKCIYNRGISFKSLSKNDCSKVLNLLSNVRVSSKMDCMESILHRLRLQLHKDQDGRLRLTLSFRDVYSEPVEVKPVEVKPVETKTKSRSCINC